MDPHEIAAYLLYLSSKYKAVSNNLKYRFEPELTIAIFQSALDTIDL